jgi:predicted transcriptional regulator
LRGALVMSTTTLKLPDALKRRVTRAAAGQGASPHAFMLAAVEHMTRAAELRASFVAEALAARQAFQNDGLAMPADAVHAYLHARAAGRAAGKPKAKRWRG